MPEVSPNQRRTAIAAAVVALAAPFEGVYLTAYRDPPGIETVCMGHTGNVDPNKTYTIGECKILATQDAMKAVAIVQACAPGAPDNVLIAFSDAVFNIGPTVACDRQHSTAARLLYAHQWKGACEQLPLWNHTHIGGVLVTLPGLTKRRVAERDLCMKGLA